MFFVVNSHFYLPGELVDAEQDECRARVPAIDGPNMRHVEHEPTVEKWMHVARSSSCSAVS